MNLELSWHLRQVARYCCPEVWHDSQLLYVGLIMRGASGRLFSPAIKAASAFALGGAAFAAANLLLARYLSTEDYGQFSLILAIIILSIPLGPLGLDAVVLRHRPGPQLKLLGISFAVGGVGAIAIVAIAAQVYSLDPRILLVIGIAILGGSVTKMCASIYQSVEQFKWSLWLMQSQNLTLIAAATATGLYAGFTADSVISVYALHWVIAGTLGWIALYRHTGMPGTTGWAVPWPEVPALFGYILTHHLSTQLDRLLIPKILDIESLATFGVLSTLVIAPFKMLQAGVGYTLIPGLKGATSPMDRHDVALHEVKTAAVVTLLGCASAFFIAPWIADVFLKGKYELGFWLITSSVLAGVIRIASVFASSIVTALGTGRQLAWMSNSAWIALAASAVGGWWGAQWGLPGFIFGFTFGMIIRAGLAAYLAVRVWRMPFAS